MSLNCSLLECLLLWVKPLQRSSLTNTCTQRNTGKGSYIITTKASRQSSPSPFCKHKVCKGLQALKARPHYDTSFTIAKLRVTRGTKTAQEQRGYKQPLPLPYIPFSRLLSAQQLPRNNWHGRSSSKATENMSFFPSQLRSGSVLNACPLCKLSITTILPEAGKRLSKAPSACANWAWPPQVPPPCSIAPREEPLPPQTSPALESSSQDHVNE